MPDCNGKFIITTIHDFKTNISKYMRLLETEQYRAVIVKRRDKPAGVFIPYEPRVRELKSGLESYS